MIDRSAWFKVKISQQGSWQMPPHISTDSTFAREMFCIQANFINKYDSCVLHACAADNARTSTTVGLRLDKPLLSSHVRTPPPPPSLLFSSYLHMAPLHVARYAVPRLDKLGHFRPLHILCLFLSRQNRRRIACDRMPPRSCRAPRN